MGHVQGEWARKWKGERFLLLPSESIRKKQESKQVCERLRAQAMKHVAQEQELVPPQCHLLTIQVPGNERWAPFDLQVGRCWRMQNLNFYSCFLLINSIGTAYPGLWNLFLAHLMAPSHYFKNFQSLSMVVFPARASLLSSCWILEHKILWISMSKFGVKPIISAVFFKKEIYLTTSQVLGIEAFSLRRF